MNPHKIEMRLAYEWTCEECGRNQFESAITAELTDDILAEMEEFFGEGEGADLVSYPDTVKCPDCGTEYETERLVYEDEDEDYDECD